MRATRYLPAGICANRSQIRRRRRVEITRYITENGDTEPLKNLCFRGEGEPFVRTRPTHPPAARTSCDVSDEPCIKLHAMNHEIVTVELCLGQIVGAC